jgi:pimeloyl-ACP methyl ester carboxylesterase
MAEAPETRYARNGDVSLAYQVFGEGAVLVAIPPFAQNIEVAWEDSRCRRMLTAFGSFSRFVHFDKRGTGMSDPSVEVASMDERVDDLRAVLDAAGVERAVLIGESEGGPIAIVFAATFPDRTSGLVLMASTATFMPRGDDHPWGVLPEPEWLGAFLAHWGPRSRSPWSGSRRRWPVTVRFDSGGLATSATRPARPPCVASSA